MKVYIVVAFEDDALTEQRETWVHAVFSSREAADQAVRDLGEKGTRAYVDVEEVNGN